MFGISVTLHLIGIARQENGRYGDTLGVSPNFTETAAIAVEIGRGGF